MLDDALSLQSLLSDTEKSTLYHIASCKLTSAIAISKSNRMQNKILINYKEIYNY